MEGGGDDLKVTFWTAQSCVRSVTCCSSSWMLMVLGPYQVLVRGLVQGLVQGLDQPLDQVLRWGSLLRGRPRKLWPG